MAFCPFRPDVVACCGLTRQRKLLLLDYVRQAPLAMLPLDEWPTSLCACVAAPLLAVGGASGTVKLVDFGWARSLADHVRPASEELMCHTPQACDEFVLPDLRPLPSVLSMGT